MHGDCTCCVPVRFLNASGGAISGIHWINKEILDLPKAEFLVQNEDDVEIRTYDLKKVSPSIIGAFLVNDIRIAPHDSRPTSLFGIAKKWWGDLEDERHAIPSLTGVLGMMFGALLIWLSYLFLKSVGFLDYPMASMVWLWAALGDWLPFVVFALISAYTLVLAAREKYFFSGFFFAVGIGLTALAQNAEDVILAAVPADANWPSAYVFLGDQLRLTTIESLNGWGNWLEPLWPMLTVLLNALGLAIVAEFVNAGIPWAKAMKPGEAGTKVTPDTPALGGARPRLRPKRAGGQGPLIQTLDVRTIDLNEYFEILEDEDEDHKTDAPLFSAELKTLEKVPLIVPEKPFFC